MLKELRVFNQDNITKIYKLEDSKARMRKIMKKVSELEFDKF